MINKFAGRRDVTRSRTRGDEGAAAVEFALVSLLLITLFLGIIEFSLILRDKVAVTSAVRAGGRIASAGAMLTAILFHSGEERRYAASPELP